MIANKEVGEGIIMSKDAKGKVIGFEKLYVKRPETSAFGLPFEFGVIGQV